MNKFESKYYDTAVRMDEAFLELLEKKDFEYITVKEICTAASVNRSTFYLHYESLNDLLMESAEYIAKKMASYFSDMEPIKDISGINTEDLFFITPENLIPWLTSIKENKRLFRTILKKGRTVGMDAYHGLLEKEILKPVLKRYGVTKEDENYMLAYYIEGILAIVRVWINDDCRRDMQEIARIIITCVAYDKDQRGSKM